MITIIHGDDIVSSRKYLLEEKKTADSPIALEGERLTLSDLVPIIEGNQLFSKGKNIFVEKFLSGKKANSNELKNIASYLQKNNKLANIFLWEAKELTHGMLTLFKDAQVKLFKLPKHLFAFIDAIYPQNKHRLFSLFHSALKETEAELIFFMMIRQFRLLIALSDTNSDAIEEVKRLAPWQRNNLQKQLKYFSNEALLSIYKKLFDIDLAQKTGSSPLSLIQAIDFFLLSL